MRRNRISFADGIRSSTVRESKSGDNKGTITGDKWYLVVSRDVRQHRLISTDYITTPVTAEAAGSSLVVPAIHSKRVERISLQPSRVQTGAFLHPFCTPFRQLEAFSRVLLSRTWPHSGRRGAVRFRGEYKVEYGCLCSVLRWRDRLRVDVQC